MITFSEDDLFYWGLSDGDIDKIYTATNVDNQPYHILKMPLTKKEIKLKTSKEKCKGSYINFYIGNAVVLVPQYNDENDKPALSLIQSLYPTRQAVGINVVNLFDNGGMIHCVTQQQPIRNTNSY